MPKHPLYRPNDKLVLLMHDGLTSDRGKTGLVLLRFAPERVVAVDYGVCREMIGAIRRRRSWKHITEVRPERAGALAGSVPPSP